MAKSLECFEDARQSPGYPKSSSNHLTTRKVLVVTLELTRVPPATNIVAWLAALSDHKCSCGICVFNTSADSLASLTRVANSR